MALVNFSEQLEAAESVLDLARLLGLRCMPCHDDLERMMEEEHTGEELKLIEFLAADASFMTWEAVIAAPSSLQQLLGPDFTAAVKRAKMRQPFDFLAVLRGLCSGPLVEFFTTATGQVELGKGLPVPFAERPLPDALEGEPTTAQQTLGDDGLLYPHPYDIYPHIPEEGLRVVLDFGHAEQLDALTWEKEERLPRIATLHPIGGGEVDIAREGGGRFFGVSPKEWDLEAVKALLVSAKAAGATLAVLPELSLPSSDALEQTLASEPDSYPAIVVAGSAHREIPGEDGKPEIRANESRAYMEGTLALTAHKYHAFKTKQLGETEFDEEQREDLTREPKTITVLSGKRTRLAVAICKDLLGTTVPRLLVDAGVNLLLVPSMTPKIGSFNPPLTEIAARRQGVAAIANTRWDDSGDPFLCMCAVPRPAPGEQSNALTGDGGNPAPTIAILDPNEPLPGAVTWPGREDE